MNREYWLRPEDRDEPREQWAEYIAERNIKDYGFFIDGQPQPIAAERSTRLAEIVLTTGHAAETVAHPTCAPSVLLRHCPANRAEKGASPTSQTLVCESLKTTRGRRGPAPCYECGGTGRVREWLDDDRLPALAPCGRCRC